MYSMLPDVVDAYNHKTMPKRRPSTLPPVPFPAPEMTASVSSQQEGRPSLPPQFPFPVLQPAITPQGPSPNALPMSATAQAPTPLAPVLQLNVGQFNGHRLLHADHLIPSNNMRPLPLSANSQSAPPSVPMFPSTIPHANQEAGIATLQLPNPQVNATDDTKAGRRDAPLEPLSKSPWGLRIQVNNLDQNDISGPNTGESGDAIDCLPIWPGQLQEHEKAPARTDQDMSALQNAMNTAYAKTESNHSRFTHPATASYAVSTSTNETSSNNSSENAALSSNDASTTCSADVLTNAEKVGSSGMPDLLSGFDSHNASMKQSGASKNPVIPEDSHLFMGAGSIGESPFVTSKSFDNVHMFGLGMSHLDLKSSPNHQPDRSNSGQRVMTGACGWPSPIGNAAKFVTHHRPSVSNSSDLSDD